MSAVSNCQIYQQFQVRIHTGFHRFTKIGQIFHDEYIFNNTKISKLNLANICLNDSETQEKGHLRELKYETFPKGEHAPRSPGSLSLHRSLRKSVSIYPRSAPEFINNVQNWPFSTIFFQTLRPIILQFGDL